MSEETTLQRSAAVVLVVEDDKATRLMLRHALKRDGYTVKEAEDGERALAAYERWRPDIVLLDAVMPVLDGFSTCSRLRQLPGGAGTPVLIITGLDDDLSVEQAFQAGATDYITKPIPWAVLRQRVRRLLQASRVETMEAHLAATEARMRAVVCNALDGIVTYDAQGIVESFNPAAERIFEYRAREIVGKHIQILFAEPDPGEIVRPGMQREVTGRRKDGATFPLEISVSESAANGHRGFTAILREITDRRGAEEALRRLEKAVETMQLGVTITDTEGRILYTNPAEASMHGYAVEELIGKDIRIFSPRKLWRPMTTEEMKRMNSWRRESVNIRKEGSTFPVQLMSDVVTNVAGDPIGIVTSCEDITKRKRAEAELQEAKEAAEAANQAKSEFLATVSHELRTPLTGMIGFLQLVLKGLCDTPEEEREYVERALESSKHLLTLISDVLDLARIEAGKLQIELAEVSVPLLLEEVYRLTLAEATQKGIRLKVDPSAEVLAVWADVDRLKQVLLNLIGNALKFTSSGGTVTISASGHRSSDSSVEISVKDSGIGIPKAKQKLIFKKFTQVDGGTTRKYGGTGLGLAITKYLVELMGGAIGVESAGEGKGARFFFTLPVHRGTISGKKTGPEETSSFPPNLELRMDDHKSGEE